MDADAPGPTHNGTSWASAFTNLQNALLVAGSGDEIWVAEQKIESLPARIEPGGVVVAGSGDALVAIQPLACTDLGRNAPIQLVEQAVATKVTLAPIDGLARRT